MLYWVCIIHLWEDMSHEILILRVRLRDVNSYGSGLVGHEVIPQPARHPRADSQPIPSDRYITSATTLSITKYQKQSI